MARAYKRYGKELNDYGGLSSSENRLYGIWRNMHIRCEKPSSNAYSRYGARGIRVCDEWHDFPTFVKWARSNGYTDNLTIDRINNDGNYEPSNCRWADIQTQSNNKSTNVAIEVCGITGNAKQWANILGISSFTVFNWNRLHGPKYTAERIIETARSGSVVKHRPRECTCQICGGTFETRSHNAKYCEKCKPEVLRERSRKSYAKKHNAKAVEI